MENIAITLISPNTLSFSQTQKSVFPVHRRTKDGVWIFWTKKPQLGQIPTSIRKLCDTSLVNAYCIHVLQWRHITWYLILHAHRRSPFWIAILDLQKSLFSRMSTGLFSTIQPWERVLKLILDTFCDGREGRHKEGYLAVWSGARAVGSVFVTCTSPIIYLPPPPPQKFCIPFWNFAFNLSWTLQSPKRNWSQCLCNFFSGGWGSRGQTNKFRGMC